MEQGIYHVTRRSLLPSILREGIVPMCGHEAYAQGQEQRRINAYTTRVAVRDALSPRGDFMRTHAGVQTKELCVLQIVVGELTQQYLSKAPEQECYLSCIIRPTDFVVLDSNLRPISSEELAALAAG